MKTNKKPHVTDIENLKDTFKIGYEAHEDSRHEESEVWNLYHNRHFNHDELFELQNRGQPAETFNVVKLFTRMLLGYYSTIVNTATAKPVGLEDTASATVLTDLLDYTFRDNDFDSEGEKIKLSAIISGLMCVYITAEPTEDKDEFGRTVNRVRLEVVPTSELVTDPASRKASYEDSDWQHRFRWVREERLVGLFGQAKVDELTEHYNFTNQEDAEFTKNYKDFEVGLYRIHNNYLVIHSIMKDENGDFWSVHWNDEVILAKTKLKVPLFPYRTTRIHVSEKPEYYGIFREIIETQKAINQALIKLQLLVNTQKAFVQEDAVEDMAEFTRAFNRVTGVIPMRNLNGLRIENLGREAREQYVVIDKALDRVQRVLGINDSFLGMAAASDSGRKVKLQQNASMMALRYLSGPIEAFYRGMAWDIAKQMQANYKAHEIFRITQEVNGDRWLELNKPIQTFTGEMDQEGNPVKNTEWEEELDENGEPKVEDGRFVVAPISTPDSSIEFTKFDIRIEVNAYNDDDEKNQLMLEQVLAGAVGQLLAQTNPAGFFEAASLSMQSMRTKNSPEIAKILSKTAEMISGGGEQAASEMAQGMPGQLAQQSQGPQSGASSQALNLPQNTTENR